MNTIYGETCHARVLKIVVPFVSDCREYDGIVTICRLLIEFHFGYDGSFAEFNPSRRPNASNARGVTCTVMIERIVPIGSLYFY